MTDTDRITEPVLLDPQSYWEHRYSIGRSSGPGSRGDQAHDKAQAINRLIHDHDITSIVDWGCGDGYLTELLALRGVDYCGIDISRTAVGIGLLRFGIHQFVKWNPESRVDITVTGELALSVDVLFHLVDDDNYRRYLGKLFGSASRFVVVYAPSQLVDESAPHVRHREWLADVPAGWVELGRPDDGVGPWLFGRDGAEW